MASEYKNLINVELLKTFHDKLSTEVQEKIDGAAFDDSVLSTKIDANTKAIQKLNGQKTEEGSVAYQIAQIVNDAPENYDTLKEIADWIGQDVTGAADLNSRITTNAGDIDALETLVGTLPGEGTEAKNIVGYIDEVKTKAEGAETTAQAASTAVTKAQEDATSAKTTAETASQTAQAASTTASAAQTAAQAAQTTADAALPKSEISIATEAEINAIFATA